MKLMKKFTKPLIALALILAIAAWFFTALGSVRRGSAREEKLRLEQALYRATAACYAAEGQYPEDVEYLKEHYGVVIDESKFFVIYEVEGENLMPQITVIERE